MILDYTKFIAAIEAHTKALVEHTEALIGVGPAARAKGRKAAGEAEGKAQTVEQLAAAAATAAPATSAAPAAATATVVTAPAQAAEGLVKTSLTLQQVADAIVKLANDVSRDAAVAILTKYGAKKVPEIKPENFDAVMADIKAASAPASAGAGLV